MIIPLMKSITVMTLARMPLATTHENIQIICITEAVMNPVTVLNVALTTARKEIGKEAIGVDHRPMKMDMHMVIIMKVGAHITTTPVVTMIQFTIDGIQRGHDTRTTEVGLPTGVEEEAAEGLKECKVDEAVAHAVIPIKKGPLAAIGGTTICLTIDPTIMQQGTQHRTAVAESR